jgi:adenosylcobinamide kinase / adenosylcobinamide-phosphate guanylyltransferase
LEVPDKVGVALTDYLADRAIVQPGAVIIDCLTLLVSNLLFASADAENEPEAQIEARVDAEVAALIHAAQAAEQPVLIVSNEVGLGIVPLGRISRLYRDLVGRANRRLASATTQAIFVVAGIPLDLKQLQYRQ